MTKRRKTVHGKPDSDDEIEGEEIEELQRKTRMSQEEEEALIAEILPKMDIIEKKTTDNSLNPKKLNEMQAKAWDEVLISLNEKCKVCICII